MEELSIWGRLADTAITFGVMSIGVWMLWQKNTELEKRNVELVEKGHTKDLENIKTLELIARTIERLESNGNVNTESVKRHISERITEVREDLRRYKPPTE
jgi:hypothetical protein